MGLEVEATALLTDNLMLRANVGYLDSEYEKFQADTDFDGITDINLSGRDVNRAPEFQWGLDFIYRHGLGTGEMVYNLNANYEDEAVFVYSNVGEAFDGVTDDRTLLNFSVTFTAADDRYFVRAFGQNLTDEEYRIGELPVANLWTMSYYGAPRTFGIEGGVKFKR